MDKHERELVYSLITRLCDLDDTLTRKQRLDILNELCLQNCNKNVEDILNNAQKRRRLQMKRGNASENETFTGLPGEITFDTTNKTIRVHDGETMGGTPLARAKDVPTNITDKIIPDYTHGITMDFSINEQTYVCPNNGFIFVDTTGFNWQRGYVKVNDIDVFNVTTNNNSSFVSGNAQFIVGAGDVITYKSGYINASIMTATNKLTFFPFKS